MKKKFPNLSSSSITYQANDNITSAYQTARSQGLVACKSRKHRKSRKI